MSFFPGALTYTILQAPFNRNDLFHCREFNYLVGKEDQRMLLHTICVPSKLNVNYRLGLAELCVCHRPSCCLLNGYR